MLGVRGRPVRPVRPHLAAHLRHAVAGLMPGHRGRIQIPNEDARLEVVCWCEATVGLVLESDVRAGQTFSCGPACVDRRRKSA